MKDFNIYANDSMCSKDVIPYYCENINEIDVLNLMKRMVTEEIKKEMLEEKKNAYQQILKNRGG